MRKLLPLLALVWMAGCSWFRPASSSEKLYFALEIRREGKVVAKPKLLGETEKVAWLERRQPGAAEPDYRLRLLPIWNGKQFRVALDVDLREVQGHWDVALSHGEARTVGLERDPGELEISLLLMKVDSPEFHALMDLGARNEAEAAPYSI